MTDTVWRHLCWKPSEREVMLLVDEGGSYRVDSEKLCED